MPSATESSPQSAPALRKAVQILDLVSQSSSAPSFSDIVSQLNLPKSSTHVLCATLIELGLLVRNEEGTYRLGPHTMLWANGFVRQTELVTEFHRLLSARNELNHLTITLTVLEDTEVIYLASVNSPTALGITFRIGMRLPAPFTATGKAILSTLTHEQLNRIFHAGWPAPLTSQSTPSLAALKEELAITRLQGFSVDNGEVREGMLCLGAPVIDARGLACAGLAVSMLAAGVTPQQKSQIGEQLARLANSLSIRLGRP